MISTLSSRKFIGIVVAVMAVLLVLWFIVPIVNQRILDVAWSSKHYKISTPITPEERDSVEKDIRTREEQIKHGDTSNGSMTEQYHALGGDFIRIGRIDLAVDAYNKALALEPSAATPYTDLGTAYIIAQDFEKAKDALQKAIGFAPTDPVNYETLADIYWHDLHQVAVARGVFIQGLVSTKQHMGLMRAYASFLDQNGYTSEALQYWQVIATKNPDDTTAKNRVKELTPTVPTPNKPTSPQPQPKKK